jgi:dihydropteroate synthase
VVAEVRAHLWERAEAALAAGIAPEDIVLDPGIGFGKTAAHNLELLRRLRELTTLGYPLLVGTSRKSTIGKVLGDLPPDDRLEGTAATVALSIANGAALVRVHDVKAMARVAKMSDAIVRGWPAPPPS